MAIIPSVTKTCDHCGNLIPSYRGRRGQSAKLRYCSKSCANKHAKQTILEDEERARWAPLSQGSTGAVSELVVCVDLMTRGYEVFRAQSPSCSCDLIALKNGQSLRVEVRTGYKVRNGDVRTATARLNNGKYDVLAIVYAGRDVTYKPSIE